MATCGDDDALVGEDFTELLKVDRQVALWAAQLENASLKEVVDALIVDQTAHVLQHESLQRQGVYALHLALVKFVLAQVLSVILCQLKQVKEHLLQVEVPALLELFLKELFIFLLIDQRQK